MTGLILLWIYIYVSCKDWKLTWYLPFALGSMSGLDMISDRV